MNHVMCSRWSRTEHIMCQRGSRTEHIMCPRGSRTEHIVCPRGSRTTVVPRPNFFAHALRTRRKIGSGHFHYANWGKITYDGQ